MSNQEQPHVEAGGSWESQPWEENTVGFTESREAFFNLFQTRVMETLWHGVSPEEILHNEKLSDKDATLMEIWVNRKMNEKYREHMESEGDEYYKKYLACENDQTCEKKLAQKFLDCIKETEH